MISAFDEQFSEGAKPPSHTTEPENSTDGTPSISIDVSDENREFVGAAAGAGAGPPMEDIEGGTGEKADKSENQEGEDKEEEAQPEQRGSEPDEQPLPSLLSYYVMQTSSDDINEELGTVPLEAVQEDMIAFATQVARTYRGLLRDATFGSHPEHEREVLFEKVFDDKARDLLYASIETNQEDTDN
jgi:hypothetical protein